MQHIELISNPKFKDILIKNGVCEIITDYSDAYWGYDTFHYDDYEKEFSHDGIPYANYYKRFSCMIKNSHKRNVEIKTIRLGCSGRNNTLKIDVTNMSIIDFIKHLEEIDRI